MTPYYEEPGITIYHGDCREILPQLPACDLMLVDPPFGIAHKSKYTFRTTTAHWMNKAIVNDEDTSLRDTLLKEIDEWACWGSIKVQAPCGVRGTLIWDKGPASGMGDLQWPFKLSYELIFLRGRHWIGSRDEGIVKGHHIVTRASMGRTHPNEKPLSLLIYLLSKHTAHRIIDPCMGAGVTLEAAKHLGREAIGIDIDEQCCETAVNRLRQGVLLLKRLDERRPITEPEIAFD